jgi:ABC-type multidrug transport system fused ATPase/permease subunit
LRRCRFRRDVTRFDRSSNAKRHRTVADRYCLAASGNKRTEGSVLAYDYPLLGLFWTMLWFFLWIAWLVALFQVIGDIFNSDDLGGWGKALWLIFAILFPLLGVLIYLIARGGGMQRRAMEKARAQREQYESYLRETAASAPAGGGGGSADELAKLADLRDRGVITPEEFNAQKAKILA